MRVPGVGNMYPPPHPGYELVWRSTMRHLRREWGRSRVLLAVPLTVRAAHDYGPGPRGRHRAGLGLPGQALVALVEIAVLARGSVRYRSLVL